MEAYGSVIDYVEADAPVSITGGAAPEWATSDRVSRQQRAQVPQEGWAAAADSR